MSKIVELVEKLPPDLQEEVVDFIEFLIEKKKTKESKTSSSNIDKISKLAGALRELSLEPLEYQEKLRREWSRD